MLTLVPVMILSIGVCPGIKILSEGCCTIPAESWFPLHLNGYEASALACPGFTATRIVYSPPVANGMEAWSVASLDMTSSGDVVVAGRVSQWYTSPEEWFVCLLDGETGIPIWKATGAGMGLAGLYQVIEAPSGVLIGVGATSPAGDGRNPWVWGQEHPLIVVIGQDGSVLMEETPALGTGVSLSGIAPLDATDCFIAVGKRPEARWMEVFRLRIATGMQCP